MPQILLSGFLPELDAAIDRVNAQLAAIATRLGDDDRELVLRLRLELDGARNRAAVQLHRAQQEQA